MQRPHFRALISIIVFLVCGISASSAQTYPPPPPQVVGLALTAFSEYDGGTPVDTIIKTAGTAGLAADKPIVIARTFDPKSGGGVYVSTPQLYPSSHILALVSRSDDCGIGTPLARWTYELPKHSFAVSIYLVRFAESLFTPNGPTSVQRDMYVARAGGPFSHGDRFFRAIDPEFQLFHLNEPYLFLGKALGPQLLKVDSEQVLKIQGTSVIEVALTHRYEGFYAAKPLDLLKTEIINAAAQQGKLNGGTK